MATDQREACIGVRKFGVVPARRPMALVAFRAVATLMVVVIAVAGDASGVEIVLKVLSSMAVPAGETGVRVYECKTGLRMIELNAAPCAGRVAVATSIAFGSRVHIVDGVTDGALSRRARIRLAAVTVAARRYAMLPRQFETDALVVESHVSPTRSRMARFTRPAQCAVMHIV